MGEALAAALIIGAASAGATAYTARQQNKAAKRAMLSAQQAAALTGKQVSKSAALEQQKNRIRSQQVIGRLRVAAAESGLAEDGSFLDLIEQADIDTAINTAVIEENRKNQLLRVQSGLEADFAQLSSRIVSPILAGFQGGLSGAQSGLAIGGAIGGSGSYSKNYIDASRTTGSPDTRYA